MSRLPDTQREPFQAAAACTVLTNFLVLPFLDCFFWTFFGVVAVVAGLPVSDDEELTGLFRRGRILRDPKNSSEELELVDARDQ